MKKYCFLLVVWCMAHCSYAQTNNVVFYVGGDADKYYPVRFNDANWSINKETVIEIGRSAIHVDGDWYGTLISKFSYHVTNYGHGSNYIHAQIQQNRRTFIGGWIDATSANGDGQILIWLRGGTTYALNSAATVTAVVYDGIQNSLPFQENNGPLRNFMSQPESYVANYTAINNLSAYFMGFGNNYFNGNVGIGTLSPTEKLSVNGKIRAKEVKVEAANWPDYVFQKEYPLLSLKELKDYIKTNGHLPQMPAAKEVESNGIELGEMNKQLLKKIEELTLHLIDKDEKITLLEEYGKKQEKVYEALLRRITVLERK